MKATDTAAIVLAWILTGVAAYELKLPTTFTYGFVAIAAFLSFISIAWNEGKGAIEAE